uniref:Uncharacterized protein n=1 Tax=Anguilla anguilla TaxID=7936 RepID=A0A0E9R222_ANGAN
MCLLLIKLKVKVFLFCFSDTSRAESLPLAS